VNRCELASIVFITAVRKYKNSIYHQSAKRHFGYASLNSVPSGPYPGYSYSLLLEGLEQTASVVHQIKPLPEILLFISVQMPGRRPL